MNKNLKGGLFDGRGKPQPLALRASAKREVTPEKNIQQSFFGWVFFNEDRFPILRWFHHIPNGGFRHKATAIAMKHQGVRPGVCDCFLPVGRHGKNGLYIEFKSKVGTVSPEQKEFIAFVTSENYRVAICRSTKDAAEVVVEYLGLPIDTKYLR